MNNTNLKKFSPIVVRYGLAFVFLWFASNQLADPSGWSRLIPEWAMSLSGLSAVALVKTNAIFEIIMAVLLIAGFQIRIVGTLLALHLAMIAQTIGWNATGVRDIGLMFAMLSVAMHGADAYSYDKEQIL